MTSGSSFPQALATRYLQLLDNRQFTEAQRALARIKQGASETPWDNGYYKALQGMLLARKQNGNQHSFMQNLNAKNIRFLEQQKKEFQKQIRKRFSPNFDRGFFSAWYDYMRLMLNGISEAKLTSDSQSQTSISQYAETNEQEQV
jgi:hypothetical protein